MPSPTDTPRLRIFVDFAMTAETLAVLQAGTVGHELIFPQKPAENALSAPVCDPLFASADVAFGQPGIADITSSSRLQWVHVSSSGITRYDTPEFRTLATAKGVALSNSASVYNEACAEHVFAFILAQARRLPLSLRNVPAPELRPWRHSLRRNSFSLRGQSVVILGYGAIGRRLTQLLAPFEMDITAYRRTPRGDEGISVVTESDLPDALADADHVINILPDSAATRHFFDSRRLSQIKPGAVFYNIGRGTTVDQDALAAALRSEALGAAWLDVTEPEPLPPDHPLLHLPNCHITPHVAGGHYGEFDNLVHHFVRNLARFTKGEPLIDRII